VASVLWVVVVAQREREERKEKMESETGT
jgi:hypothetical protein